MMGFVVLTGLFLRVPRFAFIRVAFFNPKISLVLGLPGSSLVA